MKVYVKTEVQAFTYEHHDVFVNGDILRLVPSDVDKMCDMPYPWFYMDDVVEVRIFE